MKPFLTGIIAGLAVSYLTAPRSGKQTRIQLTQAASQRTSQLKDQWDKTVSRAKKLLDTLKTTFDKVNSEPNLFADMESGKMDKYMDETDIARRKAKQKRPR